MEIQNFILSAWPSLASHGLKVMVYYDQYDYVHIGYSPVIFEKKDEETGDTQTIIMHPWLSKPGTLFIEANGVSIDEIEKMQLDTSATEG